MTRFAFFVDGSNLIGSLKHMNLEVGDYEALYAYVYEQAVAEWTRITHQSAPAVAELRRIYWYTVGSIDSWDLSIPQSQTALRHAFNADRDITDHWKGVAGRADASLKGAALTDKAWGLCFNDFREWYERKCIVLENMRRFHQGIRIGTDLIDVIEHGHWKVNFLNKWVEEKGLDTSLAVDMLALEQNYDVAVMLSGDADSIPSVRRVKARNKLVAAVEFINGTPPENKGRGFSSRLKEHADFVIRIYETELLRHKLAERPKPKAPKGTA
jgi:uncharacterized LabA/DUF88 family protein